jgi:hypothetical protein
LPTPSRIQGQNWPDTYESPACLACNDGARRDEQVLAALFRAEFTEGNDARWREWEKLLQGHSTINPKWQWNGCR